MSDAEVASRDKPPTAGEEIRFVLYPAFAGNPAAASSTFVAALSGSSALLTEVVHSSADTFKLLLLLG